MSTSMVDVGRPRRTAADARLAAMISRALLMVFVALGAAGTAQWTQAAAASSGAVAVAPAHLTYPAARTVDQVDDYHGTSVADPYRWLEDPDAPQTQDWVAQENTLTRGFLDGVPQRARIRQRLTELWDFPKYLPPFKLGGRYFSSLNTGLQNHSVLYVQESLDGPPRVLLDPNGLSQDGTVAVANYQVSDDGKLLAWATSEGGSDWITWRVRDVATGKDLDDVVRWSKFSGAAWSHDGTGFYYSAYDAPVAGKELQQANYNQKLWFHRVGTPQGQDRLVYERPDHKEWGFGGEVSEDGRFLVISVWEGSDPRNRVHVQDLAQPGAAIVPLMDAYDANYQFVGNDGDVLYFLTNNQAPRGRLVAVDLRRPEPRDWRQLIPQGEDVLQSASLIRDSFVTTWLHDVHDVVRIFAMDGTPQREIELPTFGQVGGLKGRRDDAETFYSFTSFVYATAVYRYDVVTGKSELYRAPKLAFDASKYVTEQVFYRSKDGTRIPMFLVYKKGLRHDGNNPTMLYGYGGFNISMTPGHSVSRLVWLEMGGVYAQACLRGGGEYGEEWHQAGTLHRKQNVFDDFIAAAEYLIAEGYTRPAKLAISGGSNGGLLVGACLNQRPELFGAALPAVGVMDMLRFHKFTIGWAWVSDYGSSDDAAQFRDLYAYSPYHNIRDGVAYPPTFITTADHDDRVVPGHSFKYAARLQHAQAGASPILIRIQTRAGHGAGKPTAMLIDEQADAYAFLVKVLGMTVDGGA